MINPLISSHFVFFVFPCLCFFFDTSSLIFRNSRRGREGGGEDERAG
jgi:hypothetical protein